MTDTRQYYHVYSGTAQGCDLTAAADAEARRTWLCLGCNAPKPGVGTVDITIQASPRKNEWLTSAIGWWVPVAFRGCFDAMGQDLLRDLHIGRVLGPNGRELTDWVTFRGKRRLIVRGTEHVSHRRCPECGRDLYFAMGKNHLYPAPPAGIRIFQSDICGLIMTQETFLRAQAAKWPGTYFEELSVVPAPLDGFGELSQA